MVQAYAKETEEKEPGVLRLIIHAEAITSWFAGRRVVETKGVITTVEESVTRRSGTFNTPWTQADTTAEIDSQAMLRIGLIKQEQQGKI